MTLRRSVRQPASRLEVAFMFCILAVLTCAMISLAAVSLAVTERLLTDNPSTADALARWLQDAMR